MSRDNSGEELTTELIKAVKNPVTCNVLLLDGTDYPVVISKNDLSQVLVEKVCEHISLRERDYFSCSYTHRNIRYWINPDKEISKAGKKANWTFSFELKFYPLDPTCLRDDGTRYLTFLQLRLDLINGKLPCSFITQALLGSYAVQSDIGDFNFVEHSNGGGIEYIKDIRFADKNTDEMLAKIAEIHATHGGQAPDEAEMNYLDNAKNIALYGVHMHAAKDELEDDVNVGVCAIGLIIYKGQIRVHRYPWAKILKIAYKKNKFFLKIRQDENEPESMFVYRLTNYDMAKRLWRMAVDHHGFFRLRQPEELRRAQFPHFGSKFRYSGRTIFQATEGTIDRPKRPAFKVNRKASTRFQGARALATGPEVPNFSTDRGEEMIVDAGRTNTLDLKKMNRSGSIPLMSTDDKNRNLSVIDPGGNYGGGEGKISMTAGGVGYSKQPYQQSGGAPMYDQYGNPVLYEDDYSVDGSTLNSRPRYDQSGRYSTDGDDSMRYQEDQKLLRNGEGGGAAGQGMWATNLKSSTKTSTRTYTDSDGTVITEHITEKDGVIEKRIEKRSRNTIAPEEDFDYDKALLEAIQSVTDMNPDMSVQKIEIHTKTESSA